MTSEHFPSEEGQDQNEQEPTQEERRGLSAILLELDEFAKKPWFKTAIEGAVFGPTRLLESGVAAVFRKLNKDDKDDQDQQK